MQQKYTIALCDILGFSNLVKGNPLDVVVDNTLAWFFKSLHHSLNKNEWPESTPEMDYIDKNKRVGLVLFSDTVLFYTREDTNECLQDLIQTVAWLLFETTLTDTQMRAGIAYGDAFIDPKNSIFVGKAIVEAYEMEQRQQWAGAAFAESAVVRIPENVRGGEFIDWPVVPYDVPIKDKQSVETLAINWTHGFHDNLSCLWSKTSDDPTPEDWIKNPSICEKWYYTKQFHADVCKQCKVK